MTADIESNSLSSVPVFSVCCVSVMYFSMFVSYVNDSLSLHHTSLIAAALLCCRSCGYGEPSAHLIRLRERDSSSSSLAHPKSLSKASPSWRVWMAHRNSRSTGMTAPLTACPAPTHGKHRRYQFHPMPNPLSVFYPILNPATYLLYQPTRQPLTKLQISPSSSTISQYPTCRPAPSTHLPRKQISLPLSLCMYIVLALTFLLNKSNNPSCDVS